MSSVFFWKLSRILLGFLISMLFFYDFVRPSDFKCILHFPRILLYSVRFCHSNFVFLGFLLGFLI